MPETSSNIKGNLTLQALLFAGLVTGFAAPAIFAGLTLLLAIAGVIILQRKLLPAAGWEVPRELRLLHFAFWLYTAISVLGWMISGFDEDGFKALAIPVRFILFWPLLIAITYGGLRAVGFFRVIGLATLLAACVVPVLPGFQETDLQSELPQQNLALLLGFLCIVAGLFLKRQNRLIASGTAAAAAIMMLATVAYLPTSSNVITLPLLMICLLPLINPRWRRPGIVVIALVSAAFLLIAVALDYRDSRDVLQSLTDLEPLKLFAALLLTIIPAAIFSRHIFESHQETSHTAVAGLMVAGAGLTFAMTNAALMNGTFATAYLLLSASLGGILFAELNDSYRLTRRVKVSATVITKDEAHNIGDCLQSVRQVADEIIVLDSGSRDETVGIARRYADVVEVTDWPGFGVQKQRALDKATGDWVLSIDADERITPALAREINHVLSAPDADAYKLPWAVTLYGTRLDFGRSGRAPLRLFRRDGVRFSDAMVHEKIMIPEGRTTKTLRGRLTHYTHRDFGHALEKSAKYAWLGSREKYRRGKRTRTLVYPTFRGILTFLQVYFIRMGFLDGSVGFLVAVTYAQGSFNKYAGLWTLTVTDQPHTRPDS